jgi:hypothetical protein
LSSRVSINIENIRISRKNLKIDLLVGEFCALWTQNEEHFQETNTTVVVGVLTVGVLCASSGTNGTLIATEDWTAMKFRRPFPIRAGVVRNRALSRPNCMIYFACDENWRLKRSYVFMFFCRHTKLVFYSFCTQTAGSEKYSRDPCDPSNPSRPIDEISATQFWVATHDLKTKELGREKVNSIMEQIM